MISPQSEVTYWGAIGGADSTAAFQQCADWCGEHGESMTIPDDPLYYLISSPILCRTTRQLDPVDISPPSDIHFSDMLPFHIVGHGNARVQAVAAMPSMFELIYNSALSNLGPFYSRVENIQFNGNGLATSCIKSNWVMHLSLAHNRLFGAERGLEIFGYGVARIKENVLRCKHGLFMSGVNNGGGDSVISDNDFYIREAGGSGIYMGFYSGDTTISCNVFTGEDAPASSAAVRMVGNTAPGGEHIRHVNVENNEFYGLTTGVLMAGKGSGQKNVFNCRITGNHTAPSGAHNPGQLVNATDCQEIIIDGNFCNGKNYSDAASVPLQLVRCEDVVVRDNTIANSSSAAIALTDCTDCDILDNKISNFGKLGTGYTAIDLWGSQSRRNNIRRNRIRQTSASYGQYGVAEHTGVNYSYMIDNQIVGVANQLTKVGVNSVAAVGT